MMFCLLFLNDLGNYQISLEHLMVPENKEVLKEDVHVERM